MEKLNKLIPEFLTQDDIETLNSLTIEEKKELKTLFPRKNNFLQLEITMNGKKNLQKGSYQSYVNYETLGYDVKIKGIERLPSTVESKSVFTTAVKKEQEPIFEKVVLSEIEEDVIEEKLDKLEDMIEIVSNTVDSIKQKVEEPKPVTDNASKPKNKRGRKKGYSPKNK